jgi:hypothetical protein
VLPIACADNMRAQEPTLQNAGRGPRRPKNKGT